MRQGNPNLFSEVKKTESLERRALLILARLLEVMARKAPENLKTELGMYEGF